MNAIAPEPRSAVDERVAHLRTSPAETEGHPRHVDGTRRCGPCGPPRDEYDPLRAGRRSRTAGVREPMRTLPRRRRPRRRNGTGDRRTPVAARRSTADETHQRGAAAQGHASECRPRRGNGGPREVPPDDRADGRAPAGPDGRADDRRPDARRPRARRGLRRSAAADRRQAGAPAEARRRSLPSGDFRDAVADVQRRSGRQPVYDAHADRQDDRVAAGAEVDHDHTRRGAASGDAGGRRRHHVRHGAQRSLRARRGQRPSDLAPEAAAHEGNRGRRRESGRRGRGRARLHGHRQRAPSCAESVHRGCPLGDGARGLAPELRGVFRAAACRQPDRLRRLRRRARRERLRGRVRSGDRQGSVAVLDRAEAGHAGIRNVAGKGHRARRRPDLVHRQLRRRAGHGVLADGQSEPRSTTAAIDRATTSTRARFLRSIGRPGRSSGTTSSRRTTSGTGMPRRRRCSSTRTGRASGGR